MLTNVDYISVSLPITVGSAHEQEPEIFVSALNRVFRDFPVIPNIFKMYEAEFGRGQKPFSNSLNCKGFSYYWHPKMSNSLLQVSGHGCHILREHGILDDLIVRYRAQLTRFDVASDILTDMRPFEFLPEGDIPKRISSRDKIVSKTGETFYIGSLKGSEYTRIYRYNKPHPRWKLLRVETVFRHDNAKDAAAVYIKDGFAPLVKRTAERLNITNPLYEYEVNSPVARFYRVDNGSANTLRWMQTSVSSAFKRLVTSGVIENPIEFLNEFFLE